jgi:hypothetical protein
MEEVLKQIYNYIFNGEKTKPIFKKPDSYKSINSNSMKLNN